MILPIANLDELREGVHFGKIIHFGKMLHVGLQPKWMVCEWLLGPLPIPTVVCLSNVSFWHPASYEMAQNDL